MASSAARACAPFFAASWSPVCVRVACGTIIASATNAAVVKTFRIVFPFKASGR
jgi:hypothetical protein